MTWENEFEAIKRVDQQTRTLESRVMQLEQLVKSLTAANEEMGLRLATLARILGESGHVDAKVLEYRCEAALEDHRELRTRPRCYRCHQMRATNVMIMTQYGWACDPNCQATE